MSESKYREAIKIISRRAQAPVTISNFAEGQKWREILTGKVHSIQQVIESPDKCYGVIMWREDGKDAGTVSFQFAWNFYIHHELIEQSPEILRREILDRLTEEIDAAGVYDSRERK